MSTLISGKSSIDHLLRSTQQHHIFLSGMADRKASFLIAAASVMLTIILGHLSKGNSLPVSLLILGSCSLLATLLAVLCIMPRIQAFNPKQDENTNLLFFGSFTQLSEQDYCEKMEQLFQSDRDIYQEICKEIYSLGQLLKHTKFKYLNWAYRVFLSGIIGATIAITIQLINS